MRTPITVVRFDCNAVCGELASAYPVPSAPKDRANFSQSMSPSCTPCTATRAACVRKPLQQATLRYQE
jgi:hypothetical protein